QARAIAVLRRLLKDTRALFVGPAETGLLLNPDFVSVKVPLAFAFRRALPTPAFTAAARLPAIPARTKPATQAAALNGSRRLERAPVESRPSPSRKNGIEEAFALADQGRLMEAAALCEEHMREHGASAQAYYLLGLICSADGRLYAADR